MNIEISRYIQYEELVKGFARGIQGGMYMLSVKVNERTDKSQFNTANQSSGSVREVEKNAGQDMVVQRQQKNDKQSKEITDGSGASLSISAEGLNRLRNTNQDTENKELLEKESYEEQVESSNEEADAFKDLAKMMEIARRISKGDKVPPTDEKKLMEFNSKLYQAAKAAAMLHANEKHEKHKSLFEEEEDNDIDSKLRDLERENAGNVEDGADVDTGADMAETDTLAE